MTLLQIQEAVKALLTPEEMQAYTKGSTIAKTLASLYEDKGWPVLHDVSEQPAQPDTPPVLPSPQLPSVQSSAFSYGGWLPYDPATGDCPVPDYWYVHVRRRNGAYHELAVGHSLDWGLCEDRDREIVAYRLFLSNSTK